MFSGSAIPDSDILGRTFGARVEARHFHDLNQAVQKRLQLKFGLLSTLSMMIVSGLLAVSLMHMADTQLKSVVAGQFWGPVEVTSLSLAVGMGATIAIWYLVARHFRSKYVSVALREGGSVIGDRQFAIDPEGISVSGAHGYGKTVWSAVIDVSEQSETLLIWTDPAVAVVVPKAAFKNAEELEAVKIAVRTLAGLTGMAPTT